MDSTMRRKCLVAAMSSGFTVGFFFFLEEEEVEPERRERDDVAVWRVVAPVLVDEMVLSSAPFMVGVEVERPLIGV